MYEFNYHKPTSLDEVANLLTANEEAKIVAGGMTLIPTLKLRLAKPSDLVDLAAITSLRGITDAGDALVIGAMASRMRNSARSCKARVSCSALRRSLSSNARLISSASVLTSAGIKSRPIHSQIGSSETRAIRPARR